MPLHAKNTANTPSQPATVDSDFPQVVKLPENQFSV